MRLLYIGQYTDGTTSKMRGEALKAILQPQQFEVIDTHVPFFESHPLSRSLAFRFKKGPVVTKTNTYILKQLSGRYDVIWVDKAVFISSATTAQLKSVTNTLIHYTPDTAFEENVSKKFYKSLAYYDYVITTKSFEKAGYLKYIPEQKLLFIPQGFDRKVHYPRHQFNEKDQTVIFIGLYEASRANVLKLLLDQGIPVVLAGKNWGAFVAAHKASPLTFLGDSLFKDNYATALSRSYFGLGLVSKRFPELHTTRTFEIPACGTALVTEYNAETAQYYKEDEVVFFRSPQELVAKIKQYLDDKVALEQLTQQGFQKVTQGGYDYQSQLTAICNITGVLPSNSKTQNQGL